MYGIKQIRDNVYYIKSLIYNIQRGHINKTSSADILRNIDELYSWIEEDIQECHFRISNLQGPFLKMRKRWYITKIFDLEECKRELFRIEKEFQMYED